MCVIRDSDVIVLGIEARATFLSIVSTISSFHTDKSINLADG